ncbi:ADP-glyceromanno-heptose 6-epimerase [Pontibacterium sp.]|uniref:ADP-glyceromanno-heptose 6-epimerase n=1 Tax=Pontibacterium sp. TaxID=2036026 RepID=UPI003518BAC6
MSLDLNGKKILITGGAGFIGSNLALTIQERWPLAEIVVFDRFQDGRRFGNGNLISLGHWENLLQFTGEVICGDINSADDLNRLRGYGFDYIVHQAAISDTRADDQNLVVRTNVNAFRDLLDLARVDGARMVYASSAATYGPQPAPQTIGIESPDNVYGYSKLAMDHLAASYRKQYPLQQTAGLRFFNVYGPGEYFKGKTASMVLQLGLQLLDGRTPRLFEGSDNIRRDFIHVQDVVEANLLSMASDQSGVFNVGTGLCRSFKDIVDVLQPLLGTDLPVDYFPNPYAGYQMHTEADISLSTDVLGYKPSLTLEQGISQYIPEIRALYDRFGYTA